MENQIDIYYNIILAQFKELGKTSEYYRLYSIILEKCPEEFKQLYNIAGFQNIKTLQNNK